MNSRVSVQWQVARYSVNASKVQGCGATSERTSASVGMDFGCEACMTPREPGPNRPKYAVSSIDGKGARK